jgi:hypothetical protein
VGIIGVRTTGQPSAKRRGHPPPPETHGPQIERDDKLTGQPPPGIPEGLDWNVVLKDELDEQFVFLRVSKLDPLDPLVPLGEFLGPDRVRGAEDADADLPFVLCTDGRKIATSPQLLLDVGARNRGRD